MEPLDEPERTLTNPSPADLELPSTTAMTIDIARLLNARARTPHKLDFREFERSLPHGDDPEIEPMLGLISRSIESTVGYIELPHLRVLILLTQRDSMSVAELATLMKMRTQRVFALLDSMESAGWIRRDSLARGLGEKIAIRQQGRTVVETMTERRQRDIDEILGRMSAEDQVGLTRAFNAFAAAAGEAPDGTAHRTSTVG